MIAPRRRPRRRPWATGSTSGERVVDAPTAPGASYRSVSERSVAPAAAAAAPTAAGRADDPPRAFAPELRTLPESGVGAAGGCSGGRRHAVQRRRCRGRSGRPRPHLRPGPPPRARPPGARPSPRPRCRAPPRTRPPTRTPAGRRTRPGRVAEASAATMSRRRPWLRASRASSRKLIRDVATREPNGSTRPTRESAAARIRAAAEVISSSASR